MQVLGRNGRIVHHSMGRGEKVTSETITLINAKGGTVELSGDTLLVAIDETGHENFAPTHRVFGVGGCACLVKHVGKLVDDPWRSMKAALFGGEDVRMHAAELRKPSKEQLVGLETFFVNYGFFRFGVMVSDTVKDETDYSLIKVVARMVLDRIADIAGYTHPVDVVIITESSQRTGRELMAELSAYRMGDGDTEFQPRVFTVPKAAGWSMLEVADFVMHAAQGQVRKRLSGNFYDGKPFVRKDFEVVFHRVDRRLAHYVELLEVRTSSVDESEAGGDV